MMLLDTDIKPLSPDQLSQYLEYIRYPVSKGIVNGNGIDSASHAPRPINPSQATLTRLMQRHLCTIPFSNTFVHYSSKVPAVDPDSLFQRLVIDKQPCYCFGQNVFFMAALKAIGFDVCAGLARSNFAAPTSGSYVPGPITHIVLFVMLDSPSGPEPWLVDVGFGGVNIIQPIRIPKEGEEPAIWSGTGPESYRITRGRLPCGTGQVEGRLRYLLENQTGVPHVAGESLKGEGVQNGTGLEWKVQYSFDLEQYFLHDFNALHWGTCVPPNSPQAPRVIAVKLEEVLPDAEDTDRNKYARIILVDDTVKRRYEGKTVRLAKFTSEAERIAAHLKYFDVTIPEGESVIKNRPLYLG
ncbi:cysteine proteinase [Cystobasidium minutum MCA 4210]|uniref:cysteine proteinase n=1 Tax=Cystobasidium minutum MCA 4210 TaxID=1397322 RepID=UPI0034CD0DD2|eukprot:jgi/Rhomi1/194955/gm1.3169_g